MCLDLSVSVADILFLSFSYTVDINPTGRSYASGAEDGYVRLHIFDKDYLDMKDPVPEDEENEDDEETEVETDEDEPAQNAQE
jgi:hypothetical protein